MREAETKIGIGKSHSKIILIGEHSVVYGYPAIAIPLKKIEIECVVEEAKNSFFCNETDTLSVAIFTALKYLRKENVKIKYRVISQIPQKRGMGSSAAVSIAAIRAIFDYFGENLEGELLEKLVNTAEIVAHQTPSGLDAKTCLSDKAIKFIKNKGFSASFLASFTYSFLLSAVSSGKTSLITLPSLLGVIPKLAASKAFSILEIKDLSQGSITKSLASGAETVPIWFKGTSLP